MLTGRRPRASLLSLPGSSARWVWVLQPFPRISWVLNLNQFWFPSIYISQFHVFYSAIPPKLYSFLYVRSIAIGIWVIVFAGMILCKSRSLKEEMTYLNDLDIHRRTTSREKGKTSILNPRARRVLEIFITAYRFVFQYNICMLIYTNTSIGLYSNLYTMMGRVH